MDPSENASAFTFQGDSQNLSEHEREVFNGIVDRLPDHDLFLLLQARRRWNPRNSTSTSSTVSSRSSVLSSASMRSLRGSSVSSNRDSSMSLDQCSIDENLSHKYAAWKNPSQQERTSHHAAADPESQTRLPQVPDSFAPRQKTTEDAPRYFCTYCAPVKQVSFKRRSDWKKHETAKHEPGKLYVCAHSKDAHEPCTERFHSRKPVQDHHANVHERRGCMKRCSATRISQKVVFGCGFKGCHMVFITQPHKDLDAWDERCKHVGDHFDQGVDVKDWDCNQTMLNLLRQEGLWTLWESIASQSNRVKGISWTPEYRWISQNSERLRNLLETTLWKKMDGRLSLHLNAVTFLGWLYKEAKLVMPAEVAAAHALPRETTDRALSQTPEDVFDYPVLLEDQPSLTPIPGELSIGYHDLVGPAVDHLTHVPQRGNMTNVYDGGKGETRRGQWMTPSPIDDDLQQRTMDLLRGSEDSWFVVEP